MLLAVLAGVVVLGALAVLGRTAWGIWIAVRDLGRRVAAAADRIADATAGLEQAGQGSSGAAASRARADW